MLPTTEAVAAALAGALGEPAALVAAWVDAPAFPPLRNGRLVRAVYAFRSRRLATLQHWRDEVEFELASEAEPLHVVAMEASKWARLLLKSHGGALSTAALAPTWAQGSAGADLEALVTELWDTTAVDWALRAGIAAPTEPVEISAEARFARVNGWLERVRLEVDTAYRTGRGSRGA